MTEDKDLQPVVAAEFAGLADLLAGIGDSEWDTPSLCEGWRIREVVAHMTMAARYSFEEFTALLTECGFDFTRLSNQLAAKDAGLPTAELVANLRSDVMAHWTPPEAGFHGALNHVVIHQLDVTVPLGRPRRVPEAAIREVLNGLTQGGVASFFGYDIEGRSLRATDLDWSYGSGSELAGTGEDLALAMTGRKVSEGRLQGTPLQRAGQG